MKLVTTKRFDREVSHCLKQRRIFPKQIEKIFNILLTNPAHPSLRLHKLSGTGNYSISVSMSVRILFHRERDTVFLLRIGSHEEVY